MYNIHFPIKELEHKYKNYYPLDIFRRYFYTYVYIACKKNRISLRSASARLGHSRMFLSEHLIECGREDILAKTCRDVIKILDLSKAQQLMISQDAIHLLPNLIKTRQWRRTLKAHMFWKRLEPLTPLAKAVKDSGISIMDLAKKRHVRYSTIHVSLSSRHIGWTTLFETANVIHVSPLGLALQYTWKYHQRNAIHHISCSLKDYLERVGNYRIKHHSSAVRQILRLYLSLCQSLQTPLTIVFKLYRPLHLSLLHVLRMMNVFENLQQGSPAYVLLSRLDKMRFSSNQGWLRDSLSYNKVRTVLSMQRAKDSIPLRTAKSITHLTHIKSPKFRRLNKFYSLRYQRMYYTHIQRMRERNCRPISQASDGLRLMKLRCVRGLTLDKVGQQLHLSRSRIRQLTYDSTFNPDKILELTRVYPKYKQYFLTAN